MKRPFVLLGFTAFAALALAAAADQKLLPVWIGICGGLGFCALFASLILRRKLSGSVSPRASFVRRTLAFAGAALLAAGLCLCRYQAALSGEMLPAEGLDGKEVLLRGTVLDYPEASDGKVKYLVRAEQIFYEGEALELPEFTVRLSAWQPFNCRPYDGLECTVKLYAFDNSDGLYSARNSWWAKGAAIGGSLSGGGGTVISKPGWPPGKLFAELRRLLARKLEQNLPRNEAGLIRAMLLGEREQVSDWDYSHFKQIGASHLLVVSGLHVAAIALFLSLLFGKLPLGKPGRNLLTALAVILYLCVTGGHVSSLRGGIMFLLYLLADCLGREPDSLNSLGAAVLCICLFSPFSGGDLSFALSVFATLGVLLWSGPITEKLLRPFRNRTKLRKVLEFPAASLGITFAVTLGTLPFQLAVFGGLPLIAPLANLVLVFPCTVLLYISLGAVLLSLIPLEGLAAPFLFAAGWLAKFVLWAAELLARIPGGYWSLREPAQLAAAGLLLLAALLAVALSRNRAGLGIVLAAFLLLASLGRIGTGDTVTFAASGDSRCLLVMKGDRAAVLSLGGYRTWDAASLLAEYNIRRVETLCLPVRNSKARQAAGEVFAAYDVEQLVLPEGAYLGRDLALAAGDCKQSYLRDGESIQLLEGVTAVSSHNMERLTLFVNGIAVAVETAGTGEGQCGLLFTTQKDSKLNSSFTVLQNDDILDTDKGAQRQELEQLPPGRYLLPGGRGVQLLLQPDGTVRLRGESLCPSWEKAN